MTTRVVRTFIVVDLDHNQHTAEEIRRPGLLSIREGGRVSSQSPESENGFRIQGGEDLVPEPGGSFYGEDTETEYHLFLDPSDDHPTSANTPEE